MLRVDLDPLVIDLLDLLGDSEVRDILDGDMLEDGLDAG